jgi:hypothetical protein
MDVRTLAITAVIVSCASPSQRVDAAAPGSPFARALSACKTMVRPTSRATSHPDDAWIDTDHDTTIRVLSTDPFLFQTADPGTRKQAPWYQLEISPAEVDAKLAARPFGAVVRVHYQAPPIMNSTPPPHLTAIERGPAPAAEPALLAEWHPGRGAAEIQIYADGHALVTAPPHQLIDATLSQAELDAFLDSFARAKFDALASDPYTLENRAGRVVLLCLRYHQVNLASHAIELAPIVAAFEHLRDQTLARARPLLQVADTGWHPQIFTWPADAPRLDDNWYSLKYLAAKQAAAGDDSHPMYRKLPADLAAALAAVRGSRRVIVRDHGVVWGLATEHCDTCRAGTYAAIILEKEAWQEAPDWAPDFTTIGANGLWLDGQDPRLKTLDRQYRQRGEIYSVWQAEAIPDPKP